jgi:hypothetical protein
VCVCVRVCLCVCKLKLKKSLNTIFNIFLGKYTHPTRIRGEKVVFVLVARGKFRYGRAARFLRRREKTETR